MHYIVVEEKGECVAIVPVSDITGAHITLLGNHLYIDRVGAHIEVAISKKSFDDGMTTISFLSEL